MHIIDQSPMLHAMQIQRVLRPAAVQMLRTPIKYSPRFCNAAALQTTLFRRHLVISSAIITAERSSTGEDAPTEGARTRQGKRKVALFIGYEVNIQSFI